MLTAPVVLIGVGELGGVFARGLLRTGYPLYPVHRDTDVQAMADGIGPPSLVLITVAEDDLHAVLQALPQRWRNRVGLVQNELLPQDWCKHDVVHPTVTVVWFEKKPGHDYKVILPSLVYGPQAGLIARALQTLNIPCGTLTTQQDLLFELVRKNLYILTTNIAGLVSGGTVAELWASHRTLAEQVAHEVIAVQSWLSAATLPGEQLIEGMAEAINADPQHRCTGRSAPARLARALAHADAAGLAVPALRQIATQRANLLP
jgi:ketopantoate reductase